MRRIALLAFLLLSIAAFAKDNGRPWRKAIVRSFERSWSTMNERAGRGMNGNTVTVADDAYEYLIVFDGSDGTIRASLVKSVHSNPPAIKVSDMVEYWIEPRKDRKIVHLRDTKGKQHKFIIPTYEIRTLK